MSRARSSPTSGGPRGAVEQALAGDAVRRRLPPQGPSSEVIATRSRWCHGWEMMHRSTVPRVLMLAIAGCGNAGDAGGGGAALDGGAASGGSGPFSTLSQAERLAACEAYVAPHDDIAAYCALWSVHVASASSTASDATRIETCREYREDCVALWADPPVLCEASFGADCEAPAREVQRCLQAVRSATATRAADVPACEQADLTQRLMIEIDPGCTALFQDCPALVGTGQTRDDAVDPVEVACAEACAAFDAACGQSDCADDCWLRGGVHGGEACEALVLRGYACYGAADFDCDQGDLTLAARGCNVERSDMLLCNGLIDEGGCRREPALDGYCGRFRTGFSEGYRCLSESVPPGCDDSGSATCCPAP